MSSESGRFPRPSFGFRQKISRLKDKTKEKLIRKNLTIFSNYGNYSADSNPESSTIRVGFRQQLHDYKEYLKNKTHYNEIKSEIKDKFDEKFVREENRTYPKGFYDSMFSPESESEVYFETAVICLWVIAFIAVVPTLIVTCLPRKPKAQRESSNMIFFHIFLCEIFYLFYIFLAFINVVQEFRLSPVLCDIANYGIYVTIPVMQFCLLFLSLERLTKHLNLQSTWTNIFRKDYRIQFLLIFIWMILIAAFATFMIIRKNFTFSFVKDQVENVAPPIFGQVIGKFVQRRHHCSVDGRLSSVFKTLMIILFVVLIVKPIVISIGFNILTPRCCKRSRETRSDESERRTTRLVTVFILLNLFLSLPFYLVSMFKNIFTRIEQTKETFDLILRICFTLRLSNVFIECFTFYTMERNSWTFLMKIFHLVTCKKFTNSKPIPKKRIHLSDNPKIQEIIDKALQESEDEQKPENRRRKSTRIERRRTPPEEPSEDEEILKTSLLHKENKPKKNSRNVEKPRNEFSSDEQTKLENFHSQNKEQKKRKTKNEKNFKIDHSTKDELRSRTIIFRNEKSTPKNDSDSEQEQRTKHFTKKNQQKNEIDLELDDELRAILSSSKTEKRSRKKAKTPEKPKNDSPWDEEEESRKLMKKNEQHKSSRSKNPEKPKNDSPSDEEEESRKLTKRDEQHKSSRSKNPEKPKNDSPSDEEEEIHKLTKKNEQHKARRSKTPEKPKNDPKDKINGQNQRPTEKLRTDRFSDAEIYAKTDRRENERKTKNRSTSIGPENNKSSQRSKTENVKSERRTGRRRLELISDDV